MIARNMGIETMLLEPFFLQVARQPDDVAIIDDSGRYTYGQLATMAQALAPLIGSQTTRPRVGLLLPTSAGFVASFYGALLAGKAVVALNFLLGDHEIAHVISDSGIDTILTIPLLARRLGSLPLNVIDLTQLPAPAPALAREGESAPDLTSLSTAADDPAVLMYTSGTSGLPKGVPLTYGNLQSDVDASIAHANFQSRHKFLGIIPLFHAFGMTAMMLAPLQLGATIVYMARFSPAGTVAAIRQHAISILGGVPSMFAAMLRVKEATPDDFKSIYGIISGGEPLPAALREAFEARYGVRLYEAYGMTETSLAIALNTPQMHKPGSVGKPIPGMQIRIVDDVGEALPPEHAGEIWVKGPMVMKGYHNLPDDTAAVLTADGWFKTGDLGRIDADEFLYITGRKKDLIIVAGEKVAPREVEETLMAHPAVAEAAVIGKTDASRGEVVVAYVIPREGQAVTGEEMRTFCRQRGLAQWKVPRTINVVQDLPRGPTGKVLKRELKEIN
jgi:long-chain acyl-CoA synthetase